ncbi:MAG: hypothetical protein JXR11_04005 [Balneola sp.]
MLEVTPDEIKSLNDADLRLLVGLLCEAEVKKRGGSPKAVTYGGDQNAPDGGIDVRIDSEVDLMGGGFIPSKLTGIQVKKPDMPRNEILKEMKPPPTNELRASIVDLINSSGAYLIVSSSSSTSDLALNNRIEAIKDAIQGVENAENLKVEFYDSTRVASWTREHPSLILWVKKKLGVNTKGWRSYENWSNPKGGLEEEYIIDERLRIEFPFESDRTESVLDGINKIRRILRTPQKSVRLAGLSGVGKTRFVQSFFDERIGENPLDKTKVFYTDISYSPNPDPLELTKNLIYSETEGYMIVDNCKPSLHRLITEECKVPESKLSVLTIEYDVQDEIQEETEVIRLKPSSDNLITELIMRRYSNIGSINATTIARFSDGNARVALALASTIKKGDSIGSLRDRELLYRLVQQSNDPDNKLLEVAEICSLVYSFDIEVNEDYNELDALSEISGIDTLNLFRYVAELKRRDLIQERSKWRALLPQALSNRLAEFALENYPIELLLNVFLKPQNVRLLVSFTRRLSYLHNIQQAQDVSGILLEEDGYLSDIVDFDSDAFSIFENIAPIYPEKALVKIEQVDDLEFFSNSNTNHYSLKSLLFKIAYEDNLFERSLNLILRFCQSDKDLDDVNSEINRVSSLFYIVLSGTHASTERRLSIIKEFINSKNKKDIKIGIRFLSAWLKTTDFTSFYDSTFGSRPRDYGFSPSNMEEKNQWYSDGLQIIIEAIEVNHSSLYEILELFTHRLVGLLKSTRAYEEIFKIIEYSLSTKHREVVWVKLKQVLKNDSQFIEPSSLKRIEEIIDQNTPKSLEERVRVFLIPENRYAHVDDTFSDEDPGDRYRRLNALVKELGSEVSNNIEVLDKILPDIVGEQGSGRLYEFGEGLGEGSGDSVKIWERIHSYMMKVGEVGFSHSFISGFLGKTFNKNPDFVNKVLDESLENDLYKHKFPLLQRAITLDKKGIQRILKSVANGDVEGWMYKNLSISNTSEQITDEDLCELFTALSKTNDCVSASLDLLVRKVYKIGKDDRVEMSSVLANCFNNIISNTSYLTVSSNDNFDNYGFEEVTRYALSFPSGEETVTTLCAKLYDASQDFRIRFDNLEKLFIGIVDTHPIIFLDELVSKFSTDDSYRLNLMMSSFGRRTGLISRIGEEKLIEWCNKKPNERYPVISSCINPIEKINEKEVTWSRLALELVSNSINKVDVLKYLASAIRPSSWSGSRATILETRLILIDQIQQKFTDENVIDWAINERLKLENEIEIDRKREEIGFNGEEFGFE